MSTKTIITALLALACLLSGCASTEVRERGLTVFRTQMNARVVEYRSPAGSYLRVEGMNHSTPTRAGVSGIGVAGTAGAGLITAWLTRGLVR